MPKTIKKKVNSPGLEDTNRYGNKDYTVEELEKLKTQFDEFYKIFSKRKFKIKSLSPNFETRKQNRSKYSKTNYNIDELYKQFRELHRKTLEDKKSHSEKLEHKKVQDKKVQDKKVQDKKVQDIKSERKKSDSKDVIIIKGSKRDWILKKN